LSTFARPEYAEGDFFLSMPVALKFGNWVFCHSAGFTLSTDDDGDNNQPLEWEEFANEMDTCILNKHYYKLVKAMDGPLQAKKWWEGTTRTKVFEQLKKAKLQVVVVGHQAKALGIAERQVGYGKLGEDIYSIKIDTGIGNDSNSKEHHAMLGIKNMDVFKRDISPYLQKLDIFQIRSSKSKPKRLTADISITNWAKL